MTVDRYTKLILTVIALELGWIAINNSGVQVLAQRARPHLSSSAALKVLPESSL